MYNMHACMYVCVCVCVCVCRTQTQDSFDGVLILASLLLCIFFLELYLSSTNSSLTALNMRPNPMSDKAHTLIERELVLCMLRNPRITQIDASGKELDDDADASSKGFDDDDAAKFGQGLRYLVFMDKYLLHVQFNLPISDNVNTA